jgi:transposase-like protein
MNDQEPSAESAPGRKKSRRRFDAAFKQAAVEHCHRQGGSVADTANELGINYWTLRDWVDNAKEGPPAGKSSTVSELEAENRRLRMELTKVTEQREILKKSLGILSTP